MKKTLEEIVTILDELSEYANQWPSESAERRRSTGVHQVEATTSVQVQLDAMAKDTRKLTLASIQSEPHAACDIYGRGHPTHECQASTEEVNVVGNYNTIGQRNQGFSLSSPRGTTNARQQNKSRPQGQGAPVFQNQQRQQFQPQQSNQHDLEDLMKACITKTDERLDAHGEAMKELGTSFRNLERQVGQIAIILSEMVPGTLPADTERNPKETVNVVTLRMLSQMPIYANFLKEILTKKRKVEDTSVVKLTEHCSAILQNKLPQKCGDPGSFTIPCSLGSINFDKSLCDFGASINLMPLSIYRKLEKEIGEIRSVPISLQLVDQTTLVPKGIVEDILVRIDKFVFPADFIVVNMEENKEVSLILGRLFLATSRTILDIHERKLILRVGEETVTFEMNVERGGAKKEKPTASVEWKVKGSKEKAAVSEKDKCEVHPKKAEKKLSSWMCALVRTQGMDPDFDSDPD
ncbi:uncharacterized protein [Nicotiana tomentosiformis]|uniref:uncharacterized protein n=1 Tax=Nicotiana tomentosiformis TaxID=4098 RepID=UPI00388C98CF